jgi:L-amino acid N-acyltransferase
MLTLRPATPADAEVISAIYNHVVRTSSATYQEEPESLADRLAWLQAHGPEHPVVVGEVAGQIIGWGALSPFHVRSAFRHTVEDSIYIHQDHHRQGHGRAILIHLIALAQAMGHETIVAAIDSTQHGSLALHQGLGFLPAGRLPRVGRKFGRWLDLITLHLPLGSR